MLYRGGETVEGLVWGEPGEGAGESGKKWWRDLAFSLFGMPESYLRQMGYGARRRALAQLYRPLLWILLRHGEQMEPCFKLKYLLKRLWLDFARVYLHEEQWRSWLRRYRPWEQLDREFLPRDQFTLDDIRGNAKPWLHYLTRMYWLVQEEEGRKVLTTPELVDWHVASARRRANRRIPYQPPGRAQKLLRGLCDRRVAAVFAGYLDRTVAALDGGRRAVSAGSARGRVSSVLKR